MELSGKVKEILIYTDIEKSSGGTYKGWRLIYNDSNGDEKDLKGHELSLKTNKGLKESLLALSEGDAFSATLEKDGKFWRIAEIRKGGSFKMGGSRKEEVPNEVWEQKDRRIVRQNSVTNAVNFKGSKATVEEILAAAEAFENWVYRDV